MPESFKAFEPLVASFRFSYPSIPGEWKFHRLRESEQEMLANGSLRKQDQVVLWYHQEPGKPSFNSFCDKLNKWLVRESHPTSQRMINALIEVILELMRPGRSLVDALQQLHSRLKSADVSHFAFLPTVVPEKERGGLLEFEGFAFGHFDLDDLKYRCQRAGTDFFDLYSKLLEGRPAISTPIYKRVIFDMVAMLRKVPNFTWESPLYQAVLRYFEALAAEHFEMTWSEFGEKKLLIEAFGYGIVDEEILRRLPGLWKITIYLNFGAPDHSAGYVVPDIASKTLGLPHLGEMQMAIQILEKEYQFDNLHRSSLHSLLLSICRSIATSRRFRTEQRLDEAYLHQVIALEQVFSEKEKTTQAVGGRTAALVHRQLGMTYQEAKKAIVKLYDSRSLFVHKGQRVAPENLVRIEPVSLAVVKALIHLCHLPESAEEGFCAAWLKRLDYFIAGYEAGVEPSAEMALANGLIEADDVSLP
jgi:hypothetical protein